VDTASSRHDGEEQLCSMGPGRGQQLAIEGEEGWDL